MPSAPKANAGPSDLGCGTGTHALALAARGLDVVGVDFAGGMLTRAREKAVGQGVALELIRHDITGPLPFPDAAFGAVICSYVLQIIADAGAVLSEICRVLDVGGVVVVVVEVPMRRSRSTEVVGDRHDRVFWTAKALASRLPGAVRFYDPARLRSQLTAVGLIVVQERSLARSCAALARPADPSAQAV